MQLSEFHQQKQNKQTQTNSPENRKNVFFEHENHFCFKLEI
jgi:hypothetical protein